MNTKLNQIRFHAYSDKIIFNIIGIRNNMLKHVQSFIIILNKTSILYVDFYICFQKIARCDFSNSYNVQLKRRKHEWQTGFWHTNAKCRV